MDPATLVFTWFWLGHPPAGSHIAFPSMALCQEARDNLFSDRKRAMEEARDPRRVPQLSASCVASEPTRPASPLAPAPVSVSNGDGGIDWLLKQPVNLLDWGLQRAANAIEAVRSVKVVYSFNNLPVEDNVDIDFTLVESGRFKYTIQGTIAARAPELVSEVYCKAALRAWRKAVLFANGEKPSASIDAWFSHAERSSVDRPKALAEMVAANFDFKMTINGSGQQPSVSCLTPFAVEPSEPIPAIESLPGKLPD